MYQALPDQPRARAFGLTHRVVSGIGIAGFGFGFVFVPLSAIFATQRLPAPMTVKESMQ
ncbi:hypothetical protein BLA18110_01269 [Burkholderia lata]|uniref:hypothetical protein n=1 Tax=Burkholderia lata (strain ATCC 17760 / DSM 23089 / LMG 22485 / NCIMB 9086 / R18194 / 383) TaxID=482957 RepID=UPI00145462AD|nr:hypothetical protein [Burkholderia lata]VWC62653.1 hypothetical protein BLA18110_01269 [Burkholderia lata]